MTYQELLVVIMHETHLSAGQVYREFPWLFQRIEADERRRRRRQSRLWRYKCLKQGKFFQQEG